MIEDFKTAGKLVEAVLREDPASRDDDTRLLFKVWERQGFPVPEEIQQKIVNFALTAEAVTRVRRKIQEEGRYRGQQYARRQAEAERVSLWSRDTIGEEQ